MERDAVIPITDAAYSSLQHWRRRFHRGVVGSNIFIRLFVSSTMLPSVSIGSPLLLPRQKIGSRTSPSASIHSSTPTSCFNSLGPDCCCRRCYPSRCPVCSAPPSASVCTLLSAIAGTSCRCSDPPSADGGAFELSNFPLAVGMLRRDLPLFVHSSIPTCRHRALPSRDARVATTGGNDGSKCFVSSFVVVSSLKALVMVVISAVVITQLRCHGWVILCGGVVSVLYFI